MIWTYLFCLIAGGVLITLSIAGDADGAMGVDDAPGIAEGGTPTVLFSTSFWSFGLAGFGLCGLLLTLFQGTTAVRFTLPLALCLGLALGWAAASALRVVARRDANTVVLGVQPELRPNRGNVDIAQPLSLWSRKWSPAYRR